MFFDKFQNYERTFLFKELGSCISISINSNGS